jgi:dihydroxyacetone kinase DhaKLM complex PTS-EIIA-like component DhaM
LEARYDRLVKESLGIKRDRVITFQLSALQSEGLQTLIDEYGPDSVFDVIKRQLQERKGQQDAFSTFEVIRALEPDKAKRGALYEKMLGDAKQEAEQFEEELKNNNAEERDYFKLMYGSGGNFARGAQFRIEAIKSLDSIFGKIAPQRHYKFLGSRIDEFAHYVSQFEEEEVKIKEELKQAGDDIFRLVEERWKNIDSRTEKLGTEAGELNEEISTEIQRITEELNTKLEEYRARVLSDIGKIGNMETASEEMKVALQEALSKVEGDIITRVEATQKEIEDKTAPLRQMMSSAANLDRI